MPSLSTIVTTSIIPLIPIRVPESIAYERHSHRLRGVHTARITLQPYLWPFRRTLVACRILVCVEGGYVTIEARGTVVDNGDFDGSDQRVVDTEGVAADARD